MLTLSRQGGALLVAFSCAFLAGSTVSGQTSSMPVGWSNRDVGTPAVAGSATIVGDTITVRGAGTDVGGTSDQFQFLSREISGDLDIRVRVADLQYSHTGAKAGLMIRESFAGSASNAFIFVSADQELAFQWRSAANGQTAQAGGFEAGAPIWLRLVRRGNVFEAFGSPTGDAWTLVGSTPINMGATVSVGLAVTSHDVSQTASSSFTNLALASTPSTALPAPWTSGDIGSPSVGGSASQSGGTFTMRGAGVDIWNTSDQFQFARQAITGDTEIVARVANLQAADAWSKAGIMIRASLAPTAAYASIFATGSGGWSLQQRLSSGGVSFYDWGGAGAAPGWVRLVREGNLFSVYKSPDGSAWTLVGTDTIPMPATVYVGLAVTSHKAAAAATATFSNVTISSPTSGNKPPTVAISSPSGGASYTAPAGIAISATAGDVDGTVTRVDFYAGATLLGSDTATPFSTTFSSVGAGSYSLTAIATDNEGETAASQPVTVTVVAAVNKPPTVSISAPATGASYAAPATISITASAVDTDGTVARVDFYSGATLVGSATASPFAATWSSVAAGSYSLTARATDNTGASMTSSPINVVVAAAPAVPGALPSPWLTTDIGNPGLAGSASHSGGTFTVRGAGADIWGTSDQFHFAHQPITGDTEVVARVANLQAADAWSKAGIMIRANLTATAAYTSIFATGSGGWSLQQRLASAGGSTYKWGGAGAAPGWVRLVRKANLFSVYKSPDGSVWTLVGTDTITMPATVYVGFAVTSHKAAAAATATFSNVTVSGPTAGNKPPTVAISAPAGGASYTAPATISITASAADTDGTVARVDFYAGATLVGSATASPFTATWSSVATGSHSLTAVATDNGGAKTTSAAVAVTVAGTANNSPTVSISAPATGATYMAPASVSISATAADTDGTVARVDFYAGATLVGSDTASPFSATWSSVAAGSYSLTAVATDNAGAKTTSPAVTVSVSAAPTNQSSLMFRVPADYAGNVTSGTIELRRSGDAATATPVATRNLGKPAVVSGEVTVDISSLVDPLSSGSYYGVVVMTGPGGSTPSSPSAEFSR